MTNRVLTIDQVLTLLAEMPRCIEALTVGLSLTQLHTSASQAEWSANDVLAHLRACADIWGDCIVEIATQDKPLLRAINPRTRIQKTDYPQQKFRVSLRAFTAQRTDLLAFLKSLAKEHGSRTATVTGAGKPLERTILFYAQWLASHERTHTRQIQRTVTAIKSP